MNEEMNRLDEEGRLYIVEEKRRSSEEKKMRMDRE